MFTPHKTKPWFGIAAEEKYRGHAGAEIAGPALAANFASNTDIWENVC
ncbi:hypothetical protein [Streptosporangium sp. OZ121]